MTRISPVISTATAIGIGFLWHKSKSSPNHLSHMLKPTFSNPARRSICPHRISFPSKALSPERNDLDLIFQNIESDYHQNKDLSSHALALKFLLEERDSPELIDEAARKMIFLLSQLFTSHIFSNLFSLHFFKIHPATSSYSDFQKKELIQLEVFFSLFDKYIDRIEDPTLARRLKVLFANLPCKEGREKHTHLFLDHKEQLSILADALQRQEDMLIETICSRLETKSLAVTSEEIRLIDKLIAQREKENPYFLSTGLSDANRSKLRTAREEFSKANSRDLFSSLFQKYACIKENYLSRFTRESSVKILQRVSKCKRYFHEQSKLPNDEIKIPYWYHSTKKSSFEQIIESKKILFVNRDGLPTGYSGAWVSTQVESDLFGSCTIGLTSNIEKICHPPLHVHFFDDRRWRGGPRSIPLKNNTAIFSVLWRGDKDKKKKKKQELYTILASNSFPPTKIVSDSQLRFLQKEVESILGNPNLPNSFWGWH